MIDGYHLNLDMYNVHVYSVYSLDPTWPDRLAGIQTPGHTREEVKDYRGLSLTQKTFVEKDQTSGPLLLSCSKQYGKNICTYILYLCTTTKSPYHVGSNKSIWHRAKRWHAMYWEYNVHCMFMSCHRVHSNILFFSVGPIELSMHMCI